MPRGKSSNGNGASGAHLPVLVDPRLVKALDDGLSQVSYHVKVLRDDCDGMIEETRTEPRRGAVEHYYRASGKTLFPAKAWRRLKKGLRAVVGAGQASDLFNDLAEALKAGKLQGEHDHITRTPLVLDAEGERNVKAIAERATKEVENEQRATAKRMEKANGDGGQANGYTFALLAFEAAWEPADLHALVAQAEEGMGALANGANGAGRNGDGRKRTMRKAPVARAAVR